MLVVKRTFYFLEFFVLELRIKFFEIFVEGLEGCIPLQNVLFFIWSGRR